MWWGKMIANLRENFRAFGTYARLAAMPENLEGLGPWTELPDHLR
jgi:hypothetical protein